jgi:outer membrane receptor protein involved in Fe transport
VLDYVIIFSGNPNLDAEESENFNFGLTFNLLENLDVSIDYWDITQENKIDDAPFAFLYNSSCDVQNSTVCVRSAPLPGTTLGPLQSVSTSFVNIGEQSATGIDVLASDFDRIELNATGDAFVTRPLAGEYEYPEHRFQLTGNYAFDDWSFYAQVDFIGEFEDLPDVDFDGVLDFDSNTTRKVDTRTRHSQPAMATRTCTATSRASTAHAACSGTCGRTSRTSRKL